MFTLTVYYVYLNAVLIKTTAFIGTKQQFECQVVTWKSKQWFRRASEMILSDGWRLVCKSSQRQVIKSRTLCDANRTHSKICPFLSRSFAPILQTLHLVVFACSHSMLSSTANQDKTLTQSMQISNDNNERYSKDKKSDHNQSWCKLIRCV